MAQGNAMKNTGTVVPTAGRLARRDAGGRTQVNTPVNPLDAVNKQYVDQFAQGQGRYIVAAQGPGGLSAPQSSGYQGQMMRGNAAGDTLVFFNKEGGTYDPPVLYISTDGGVVWTKTAQTVPWALTDTGYLSDRCDIWVQDANNFTIFAMAQGMLQTSRTTNGGASFTNYSVSAATSPNTTYSTVLAYGIDSAIYISHYSGSGYRLAGQKTTNSGQTWGSEFTIAAYSSPIYWSNIAISTPDAGQNFFLRAQRQVTNVNPVVFSISTFKSSNGGTTWTAGTDVTNVAEPANNYSSCRQKIHAVSTNVVLVATVDGATGLVRLYRSTDAMSTWNLVGTPYSLASTSYYNVSLEKDPTGSTITLGLFSGIVSSGTYATALTIVRSTDSGATWSVHSRGDIVSGYTTQPCSRRIAVDSQGRFFFCYGTTNSQGQGFSGNVRQALKLLVAS